jgi:hypothetical protein
MTPQAASFAGDDIEASAPPWGDDLKIVGRQASQLRAFAGVDCTQGRSIDCIGARLDLDENYDIAV